MLHATEFCGRCFDVEFAWWVCPHKEFMVRKREGETRYRIALSRRGLKSEARKGGAPDTQRYDYPKCGNVGIIKPWRHLSLNLARPPPPYTSEVKRKLQRNEFTRIFPDGCLRRDEDKGGG